MSSSPPIRREVLKQVDLSPFLVAGRQRLELTESSKTGASYQVTFRYHIPEAKPADKGEPLTVRLAYDRAQLRGRRVGESDGEGG